MSKDPSNWFSSWFNTPYYQILYKDRDYAEANAFMETLTNYLNLPEHATILDVGCEQGQHAIYLNDLGYDIIGVDLSENNIKHAKKFEKQGLRFDVHNMCKPYNREFDAVFNLFSNFGY